jgi:NADH-quinone oxidoreductase subunit G
MATPENNTVKVKVDGEEFEVAAGQNLIEVVKQCGGEVPHYCYHPDLSVAGNCRMCQVEVVGMPKLTIACNTVVRDGMEVLTHRTSQKVADTQAATLEFILINHPLDCTVCDQAGHCKLQDYHYEYNARPSRFLEEKVHQVKAYPLGPTVMLDGERCISCTRCVRFCDEITGTSELGLLNRGDKSVIAVNQDFPLENPFSGTVVDLCPVGALTHREWRFNSRIWFTNQVDTICTGCSTGCNVRAAERDGEVVQVKARRNPEVNKEWLCDKGRYGFQKLVPSKRVPGFLVDGSVESLGKVAEHWKKLKKKDPTLIVVAPDLTLEDYVAIKALKDVKFESAEIVCNCATVDLTELEAILISPDTAPNYQGFLFSGLGNVDVKGNIQKQLEQQYLDSMSRLIKGDFKQVLFIGNRVLSERVLHDEKSGDELRKALEKTKVWSFHCDMDSLLIPYGYTLPTRMVLERSGLFLNGKGRLQYLERILPIEESSLPVWRWCRDLEPTLKKVVGERDAERDATRFVLKSDSRLEGVSLAHVKSQGLELAGHAEPKK